MQPDLSGQKILIVKGSLLAPAALEAALAEHGAKPFTATNLISAFSLIEQEDFDAAVIDKGLHNEAFDLCAELTSLGIPHLLVDAPHELQKPSAQKREAYDVLSALAQHAHAEKTKHDEFKTGIFAARYPAVKGLASMGVINPARI